MTATRIFTPVTLDRRRYARRVPIAVLIPIKAFHDAKRRLATSLTSPQRAELAQQMAAVVIAAAHPLPVFVVCDDLAVTEFSIAHGAEVIWCPSRGLNGAVTDGVLYLADAGFDQVIVAHADLPHAQDLAWVADFEGVTIVPDRHQEGTNVMCVPTNAGFNFAYGPGSFLLHSAEAERCQLPLRVAPHGDLGHDVDSPSDLVGVPIPELRP